VVSLAIAHHRPEILSLVLRGHDLNRYHSAMQSGLLTAAEKNNTAMIRHLYQLAPKLFADTTICDILEIAARLGNHELIEDFIDHEAILKSPDALFESLQAAMDNNHEAIALRLLQAARNKLKIYAKRELFIEAAEKGFNTILNDLYHNDDLKVDHHFFEKALQATGNQFPAENQENQPPICDVMSDLTNALSQLKIYAAPLQPLPTQSLYLPSYLSAITVPMEQVDITGTGISTRPILM
jgi:hypothetical protein